MLAIGPSGRCNWAGRAVWGVPATFVGVMALAAVVGHQVGAVPALDQGAAATVLALGLLVGTAARLPVAAGMTLAAFFALFHGFAHGAESPSDQGFLAYGAGFVLATAALHAAGIGLGLGAARLSANSPRLLGWGIAAAGVVVLAR